ncbi:MAG: hypothetical protein K6F53_11770, partial [Lachnospiraceae bacterium]|nr:hypothetical protein [Lachnospiraceae bacterium]
MIRVVKELIGFTLVSMIVLLLAAGTKLWVNANTGSVYGNGMTAVVPSSATAPKTVSTAQGNLRVGAIPQTTLQGVYATNRVTAFSVSTSMDKLRTILLSPAEIVSGDKLSIYVCNSKNHQREDLIKTKAVYYPGESAAVSFQADLYKTNTYGNVTAIRESVNPITITIGIPAHLRKANREFRVLAYKQSTGEVVGFRDVDLSDT